MTAARIYEIALFQPDLAFCIPLIQLFVGLIAAGIHPGIYNKTTKDFDKNAGYLQDPDQVSLLVNLISLNIKSAAWFRNERKRRTAFFSTILNLGVNKA